MDRRQFLAAAAAFAQEWETEFAVDRSRLGTEGNNPYFVLTPGLKLHYAQGRNTVVTAVLAETKRIDGVEARAVEYREARNGKLIEVTRDYFAVDRVTGDVYYMGEDVDVYKNGKVAGHEGAWLAGSGGARFGLMMPGRIKLGRKFYQEYAPGVAMDRAEVVGTGESVTTPAGTFRDCVRMKETSPLEKLAVEYKVYAPGIGLVKDGEFELVRIERPE
jgi:hypothetical protein